MFKLSLEECLGDNREKGSQTHSRNRNHRRKSLEGA
jgi:hypothetical protein